MSDDFKKDIRIDKLNLDVDCMGHPLLYLEWSNKYTDAVEERDAAKNLLDLTYAEVAATVREDPSLLPGGKVTEAAIQAYVIQDSRYKEVMGSYLKKKKDAAILGNVRESLEHRRSSLDNLVKLYLGSYWAEPKVPKEVRDKFADDGKKKHRDVLKRRLVRKKEEA